MVRKRQTNLKINKGIEDFINDLQVFADLYIDEVNNYILDHLEELIQEDAIHYLLDKYVHKVSLLNSFKKNYLLRAYENGTDVDREDFMQKEVSELQDILYQLCYRRFKERDEIKAEEEKNNE